MTRKHGANRPHDEGTAAEGEPQPRPAEVESAAHVVEQARAALERAEAAYRQTLQQVTQQASRARGVTVGDIIDGTLEFVRRHPAAGLLAMGVAGFLLGRTTRR